MASYGQGPRDSVKTNLCQSYSHVCSNVLSQSPLQGPTIAGKTLSPVGTTNTVRSNGVGS